MMAPSSNHLGFGLGFRAHYYDRVKNIPQDVDWFECITEDYLDIGGRYRAMLEAIRQNYPVVFHGVSMNLGGCDPLEMHALASLKRLCAEIEPAWVSDHLCWTGTSGVYLHDLLPLPWTQEAIEHVVSRIDQVQNFLGRQILIENVSSYVTFKRSEMSEWEFLSEVAERADCLILLDVNNIYVNAFNHQFSPHEYLRAIPADRVWQYHIAGHTRHSERIVDTHDHPIVTEVWDVYREALQTIGPRSLLIERDDRFPPWEELVSELKQARAIEEQARNLLNPSPVCVPEASVL